MAISHATRGSGVELVGMMQIGKMPARDAAAGADAPTLPSAFAQLMALGEQLAGGASLPCASAGLPCTDTGDALPLLGDTPAYQANGGTAALVGGDAESGSMRADFADGVPLDVNAVPAGVAGQPGVPPADAMRDDAQSALPVESVEGDSGLPPAGVMADADADGGVARLDARAGDSADTAADPHRSAVASFADQADESNADVEADLASVVIDVNEVPMAATAAASPQAAELALAKPSEHPRTADGNRPSGAFLPQPASTPPQVAAPHVAPPLATESPMQAGFGTQPSALDSAIGLHEQTLKDASRQRLVRRIVQETSAADGASRGDSSTSAPHARIAPLAGAAAQAMTSLFGPPLQMQSAAEASQGLAQRLVWMMSAGVQRAHIALSPEELGRLEIRVEHRDDGVSVTVVAHHAQTREWLEQGAGRLRDLLAAEHLQLAQFDVHADQGQQRDGRQFSGDAQQPRWTAVREDNAQGLITTAIHRHGLLDTYA